MSTIAETAQESQEPVSGKTRYTKKNFRNAEAFIGLFHPYRKRHLRREADIGPALFPDTDPVCWTTVEAFLSHPLIENAIRGRGSRAYGFFLAYSTLCFGIDLDDHAGKGWGYLWGAYTTVKDRLGAPPSLVAKSPRGLHIFYLFQYYVPELLLVPQVERALRGLACEVKPTSTVGLRLPREGHLLDPETGRELCGSFWELAGRFRRYHPFELFNGGLNPEALRAARWDRIKRGEPSEKSLRRLSDLLGRYAGILPRTTNDALCEVIPICRSFGLSAEESAGYFVSLLSPYYAGELRNERRLLQRVRSFYRTEPATRFNRVERPAEVGLFTLEVARNVAGRLAGPVETNFQRSGLTKRRNTVRKAVIALEQWSLYVREVRLNKGVAAVWDYLYPYFRKNTKEGYAPVPRNLWKSLHEHYEAWLLPFLEEVGYVERSPYPYSSVYGICYYYKMHEDRFIERLPSTPVSVPKPKRKSQVRAEEIRAYKAEHPGKSNRAIAKIFRVDEKTVRNALR